MDASGEVVHEGFFCPVCKKNCFSSTQLKSHFGAEHNAEPAKADGSGSQLKDIFKYAKDRIFKPDLDKASQPEPTTSSAQAALGYSTSLTRYFKKLRSSYVDQSVIETNKLIIRLDKMISNLDFDDASKRTAIEREVVPWIVDNMVKQCQFCNASFNLTRRKHHCRLCGCVLCAGCCKFISLKFAKKLTNPAFAASAVWSEDGTSRSGGVLFSSSAGRLLSNLKRLSPKETVDRRDRSTSPAGRRNGQDSIRICSGCEELLLRRDRQQERLAQSPMLVAMYEDLRAVVQEVQKIHQSYLTVSESLWAGESVYELEFGHELRNKLINKLKQVDTLSEKILSVCPADVGAQWSPEQLLLQRNIRRYATDVVSSVTSNAPTLPNGQQFAGLRGQRLLALRKDLVTKRQSVFELPGGGQPSSAAVERGQLDLLRPMGDDLLKQQIALIKQYIKQAAMSGNVHELNALRKNLEELEAESEGRRMSYVDAMENQLY